MTKKTEKKITSWGISIKDQCDSWDTSEANPDDAWSRASTAQSHSIEGFVVSEEEGYFELKVGFEPKFGEDYFLVYALYSTGDSFGHDAGRILFVDLYKTKAKAAKAVEILTMSLGYTTKLKNEAGQSYTFSIPWNGYFESLEDVRVETVHRKKNH